MSDSKLKSPAQQPQTSTLENFWKFLTVIIFIYMLCSVSGFLSFREIAKANGYDFVRNEAWLIVVYTFFIYWGIRHTFFKLFRNTAYAIVHPKFCGNEDERIYRMTHIQKLTFDMFFYLSLSFAAFYLFSDRYWFPKRLGGSGNDEDILRDYPNWPHDTDHFAIETYYMVQLGVYVYKIAESFSIRRKTYRKVYQFLLHHFIAFTLILFSLLTNLLPVGVVILFLHDICDATSDMIRIIVETKFRNIFMQVFLYFLAVGNWVYMRLYVFPVLGIWSLYHFLPKQSDAWYVMFYPQWYLMILCCVLIVMHVYWWLHIVWGGVGMLFGKGLQNPHDKAKQQKQE